MALINKPLDPGAAVGTALALMRAARIAARRRAAKPPTLEEINRAAQRRDIAAWNAEVERRKYLKKRSKP